VENFDWSAHKIQDFPYLLQQKPGPKNVLGQVKFLFPNKHSVYLHDTNSHHLFEQSRRTFSSGCIRVEKAARLSSLLLPNKTLRIEKPRSRVATEVANDATELADTQQRLLTTDITPQEFIPKRQTAVNIYYLTAWPTPQNEMHYRRDIYHYDAINQADFATLTQHFQPPSDNLLTAEVRGL
jgi:murein L,D-transpeptidase YcbB/YkuD